jgi:putative transposase
MQIAAKIRHNRPVPADEWHLDEVVISICGQKHWLWRALDANGDVLEILMQSRRNAQAARRFFMKLMQHWSVPRVLMTDKLPSYGVAVRDLCQASIIVPKRGLTTDPKRCIDTHYQGKRS